jgi:hydroxymethylpyrimidine/phosphomethylpyrimidine kinase
VLSIAGSDSGGGAGIQADLKAFAACGAHGMTAITAITAQNSLGVTEVHQIPPDIILAQVRAVSSDIGVDAVKIGMLGDAATIEVVARAVDELPRGTPVVARAVHALGPRAVVVTGGHREQAIDVFFDGETLVEIAGERHPDGAAHGSGCTHSSVLAACLAWGREPLEAARRAKELAATAVANGLAGVGSGAGPVDVLGIAGAQARPRGARSAFDIMSP